MVDIENGDVERTATQVEHEDGLILFLVYAVRECGGGRLVDYPQNLQTGDSASVLSRFPLSVAEVSRAGDDRLLDISAKVLLGVGLEFLKDECGDLLRSEFLIVDLLAPLCSHLPLDRHHSAVRVGYGLALGGDAHESLVVLGEGDHARCGPRALRVRYDDGLTALQCRHAAVGCSKINSYHRSAHFLSLLSSLGSCQVECNVQNTVVQLPVKNVLD